VREGPPGCGALSSSPSDQMISPAAAVLPAHPRRARVERCRCLDHRRWSPASAGPPRCAWRAPVGRTRDDDAGVLTTHRGAPAAPVESGDLRVAVTSSCNGRTSPRPPRRPAPRRPRRAGPSRRPSNRRAPGAARWPGRCRDQRGDQDTRHRSDPSPARVGRQDRRGRADHLVRRRRREGPATRGALSHSLIRVPG